MKSLFVVIAGGGETAKILSQKLTLNQHNVVLIESDHNVCSEVAAENSNILVICGDAQDIDVLKKAKVNESDVFIALTSDDSYNLVIGSIVKKYFGVPYIMARSRGTPDEISVLFGIDFNILKTEIVAKALLNQCLIAPYHIIGAQVREIINDVVNASLIIDKGARVVGMTISDLISILKKGNRKFDCIFTAITRDGKTIIPHGDESFLVGDRVRFNVVEKHLEPLIMALTEKKDMV